MYQTEPGVQFLPFATAGQNSGQWFGFNPVGPFTFSIPPGYALGSLYVPVLASGGIHIYAGLAATGTPFYTTASSGAELIPLPSGLTSITLQSVSGAGSVINLFISSLNFEPFRQSPVNSQVTSVTASAPVVSSGGATPNISLTTPLAIVYGGTGTTTPSLVAGSGITVTGSFPNQTIAVTGGGVVTSVTASAPLGSSGGATPNISLSGIVPVVNGGTGTATPAITGGQSISATGTWPNITVAFAGNVIDGSGTLQPGGVVQSGSGNTNSSGLLVVNKPSGTTTLIGGTGQLRDSNLAHNYFCTIDAQTGTSITFLAHDDSGTALNGATINWTISAF